MKSVSAKSIIHRWLLRYGQAWDRFWFAPRLPNTLGVLRILTGAMLLYSHLVLATELTSFLGDNAWINNDVARQLHDGAFADANFGRSYLWSIGSPFLLWVHHGVTLLVTFAFMIGFMTRFTAPAAWFLQIMYLHRLTGALFGLDQIVTYSAMYLMLAPCGSCYSIDAWLRRKRLPRLADNHRLRFLLPGASPSVSANVATRLFQLHLCVIYLFGGLAKARGETWWDGTAVWFAIGNYEYQSLDMTWMASYPRLFSALSHITLFWEVFYIALIWPRITRPLVLAVAVAVHGGIGLFLGMATFGIMMIAANLIFVEPQWLTKSAGDADDGAEQDSELDDFELDDFELEDVELDESALSESDFGASGADSEQDVLISALPEATEELQSLLDQRAQKIKAAKERIQRREAKLKEREAVYDRRVKKLKIREAKIKRITEQLREKKAGKSSDH